MSDFSPHVQVKTTNKYKSHCEQTTPEALDLLSACPPFSSLLPVAQPVLRDKDVFA